jgi:hypothetical protein
MKKQDIEHLEVMLGKVFRRGKDLKQMPEWSTEVLAAVRRCHATENIAINSQVIPVRMMWQLATGLVVVALLCSVLYMSIQFQRSSVIEVPLDSFDNTINLIMQIKEKNL